MIKGVVEIEGADDKIIAKIIATENTYYIKQKLKKEGYKWNSKFKVWEKETELCFKEEIEIENGKNQAKILIDKLLKCAEDSLLDSYVLGQFAKKLKDSINKKGE